MARIYSEPTLHLLVMSVIRCLRGLSSGAEYPADTVMNLDPADGRLVEIVMDLERLQAEHPNLGWYHPERNDLWRFGALLPLDLFDAEASPLYAIA